MGKPIGYYTMGPGSVVVVAPHGRIVVAQYADGSMRVAEMTGCDLIGVHGGMTPEHKSLVSECWAKRTLDGKVLDPNPSLVQVSMSANLVTALTGPTSEIPPVPRGAAKKDLVEAKDKPAVRAPWWRFWK